MARPGDHGRRRRALLADDHAGAGAGKPLTVARLLADDTTAHALEVDFLRLGLDLLDLYRDTLSFRRVCAIVAHLPDDAAVWRATGPDGGWTRDQIVLAALERRVTLLWATVSTALGGKVSEHDVTGPLDRVTAPASAALTRSDGGDSEPDVRSLREIALWMQQG